MSLSLKSQLTYGHSAVELNLVIICSCAVFFPSFYRSGKKSVRSMFSKVTILSNSKTSRSQCEIKQFVELNTQGMLNTAKTDVAPFKKENQPPQISTLSMTRGTIDFDVARIEFSTK